MSANLDGHDTGLCDAMVGRHGCDDDSSFWLWLLSPLPTLEDLAESVRLGLCIQKRVDGVGVGPVGGGSPWPIIVRLVSDWLTVLSWSWLSLMSAWRSLELQHQHSDYVMTLRKHKNMCGSTKTCACLVWRIYLYRGSQNKYLIMFKKTWKN
jgi:hypothetical protein